MSLMAVIRGQWEHIEDDRWQLCVSPRITKLIDYRSTFLPSGRIALFTQHDPSYYLEDTYPDRFGERINLHRLELIQDEDSYEYEFFLLIPKASFDFKARYQRRIWLPVNDLAPDNPMEAELKRRLGLFTAPPNYTFQPQ